MISPLMHPMRPPQKIPSTIAMNKPVFGISWTTIIPATAMVEPTDISIPPEEIINVMPNATNITGAICTTRFHRVWMLKNPFVNRQFTTSRNARNTSELFLINTEPTLFF